MVARSVACDWQRHPALHAVYWPAMCLSAGLLPAGVFGHGFSPGKAKKSQGNSIDPAVCLISVAAMLCVISTARHSIRDDGDIQQQRLWIW